MISRILKHINPQIQTHSQREHNFTAKVSSKSCFKTYFKTSYAELGAQFNRGNLLNGMSTDDARICQLLIKIIWEQFIQIPDHGDVDDLQQNPIRWAARFLLSGFRKRISKMNLEGKQLPFFSNVSQVRVTRSQLGSPLTSDESCENL